jgi:hypothetical protein
LSEHIAAGIFQVDEDDVRIERVDASEQFCGFFDADHVGVASFTQPVGEDRRADRAFVYDDNL